jgi:hypothetical protein
MQRETLLQQCDCPAAPFFQSFRRTVRSHVDTSSQGVHSILHYLCGSQ